MDRALPPAASEAEFDRLDLDTEPFTRAAAEVARRSGAGRGAAIERIRAGSLPVFAVGSDVVLKFFPPYWRAAGEREARFLEHLHGQLDVPTPELLGREELGGWEALVLRRLEGESWQASEGDLTADDQVDLAAQAGELARTLHGLDPRPLGREALPADDVPWPRFLAERRADAVARQRRLGLGEAWLEQIEPWLESVVLPDAPQVLLHTELMRAHLFVVRRGGRYRLSGLLDFEPARIGAAEYELASVGLFVACGNAAVLRAFLRAYGHAPASIDLELQRRCMAWALLHRYANVPGYLRLVPVEPGARTLDALARSWWPV